MTAPFFGKKRPPRKAFGTVFMCLRFILHFAGSAFVKCGKKKEQQHDRKADSVYGKVFYVKARGAALPHAVRRLLSVSAGEVSAGKAVLRLSVCAGLSCGCCFTLPGSGGAVRLLFLRRSGPGLALSLRGCGFALIFCVRCGLGFALSRVRRRHSFGRCHSSRCFTVGLFRRCAVLPRRAGKSVLSLRGSVLRIRGAFRCSRSIGFAGGGIIRSLACVHLPGVKAAVRAAVVHAAEHAERKARCVNKVVCAFLLLGR